MLIAAGCTLALLGMLLLLSQSVSWLRLGKLPGDIRIERENFTLFFPVTTMVLLSGVASLVWYSIARLTK